MAINFTCQRKRHKAKSIGSPDPMDAFLGLYHNESSSDGSDDDWSTDADWPTLAPGSAARTTSTSSSSSSSSSSGRRNLPPEPQAGNVEYKLKLVDPTKQRFEHLVTQMKWRLREGQGEAIYEIGVADDGFLHGLTDEEMEASLETLSGMARRLGAHTAVLRRRSVDGAAAAAAAAAPAVDGVAAPPPRLSVAEVLVRKAPDDRQSIELRVAVLGNADSGKSTLIGVLTQGRLDNGRGLARLNMFRHLHEVQTGRTSCVSHEILGFDAGGRTVDYGVSTTAQEICQNSTKLVTLVDLAGHHKYLRTTVRGLTSYAPHYVMLVVSGSAGVVGTASQHLGLALALEVPFFVVVTKQDACRPQLLQRTLAHLETLLKAPGCRKVPVRIETEDDVITAAGAASLSPQSPVVPVFVVSSVTGHHLALLTKLLHLLPPGLNALERDKLEQEPVEFQIYETFRLPQVGSVMAGLVTQGILTEKMNLVLGPFDDGSFHPVQVESIERYKSSCRSVRAGQSASLALDTETPHLRNGMILAAAHLKPRGSLFFQATVVVLFHSTSIHVGFQTTVHLGSVRQTAVIEGINLPSKRIGTNDTASCLFRFVQHPELVRPGARLLFRTGSTQGIGRVTQVFPVEPPEPAVDQ